MDDIMKKYNEITYKIPPVLTAAAVPVVALSLLCKTGSLAPKLGDLGKAGDVSEAIKILTTEGRAYGGFGEDSRGKNATERLNAISKSVDPKSQLGLQMADIEKRKKEL
jgi:hypothetical protein